MERMGTLRSKKSVFHDFDPNYKYYIPDSSLLTFKIIHFYHTIIRPLCHTYYGDNFKKVATSKL